MKQKENSPYRELKRANPPCKERENSTPNREQNSQREREWSKNPIQRKGTSKDLVYQD